MQADRGGFPLHIISRAEYDSIWGRDELPDEYPINTAQAIGEMRFRGLDVRASHLDAAIRRGKVEPPSGEGRNRKWEAAEVDAAMLALLEDDPRLTTWATVALHFAGNQAQLRQLDYQRRMNPNRPLVWSATDHAIGLGVPAEFSVRPMTDEEESKYRQRVDAAREALPESERHLYGGSGS